MLDKALALFLQHGFAGTSVDAITQSASMAKRTIYARYGDKANLFRAAVRHGADGLRLSTQDMAAQETDDFRQTFGNFASLILRNAMSRDGARLLRLIRTDVTNVPEIADDFSSRAISPLVAYLADLIRRRCRVHFELPDDAEIIAALFVALITRGMCPEDIDGRELTAGELDRHGAITVDLFVNGMAGLADAPQLRHDRAQQLWQ